MQDHIINDQIADLARAMLELDNMDEAYRFFEDIFTIHELQAVAQRLAVARLLQKKVTYQEIAEDLDRHVKSIDNALQRVKKKLEKFIEQKNLTDRH